RKSFTYRGLLEEPLRINPDSLDEKELHDAAYALVAPLFRQSRKDAEDRFRALHGDGSTRAVIGATEVVPHAAYGRVDCLFVASDASCWGRFDADTGDAERGEEEQPDTIDLLDFAAAQTLLHGGPVYIGPRETIPES